jgi:uracil-DNA glycosylase
LDSEQVPEHPDTGKMGTLESWKFLKFFGKDTRGLTDPKCGFREVRTILRDKDNVLPRQEDWFKALELTPFDKVKVVILGQDPYHTKGMAHGLAFSVQPHIKTLPPSLRNILKEYQSDLGYPQPRSGDLRAWAERGVLLWNTILTVEEGKPLSHADIGWEKLTYEIIRSLQDRGDCTFLLMGKKAQAYAGGIDPSVVIGVPHPSPLSKGFIGSKPFTRTNQALAKLQIEPVEWRLT